MTINPTNQKEHLQSWLLYAYEHEEQATPEEKRYFECSISNAEKCCHITVKSALYVDYNADITTFKTDLKQLIKNELLITEQCKMLAAVMGDRPDGNIEPLDNPSLQKENLAAHLTHASLLIPPESIKEQQKINTYFNAADCASFEVKTELLLELIEADKRLLESIREKAELLRMREFMQKTLMKLLAEPIKKHLNKRANA